MSKEEKEEETQPTETITDILDKLVPPDEIEIIDIFGNSYKKPCILSARKQIKVVREFEQMILYVNETDLSFSNNVELINSIIKAATDENVLIHLGLCFEQAFPKVVEKSKAYAKKKKIELDPDTPILDIFSIEELVGSVVPLFIRLAKKLSGALATLS